MPFSQSWTVELWRIGLVALAACLVGLNLGELLLCLLIGTAGLLIFYLYQMKRLERWAQGRMRKPLQDVSGPLATVHGRLYQMKRQTRRRKKRVRQVAEAMREAARAMPDATVLLGVEDEVLWCNKAARELLGLDERHDRFQPIANMLRTPEFVTYLDARDFNEPLEMNSPVDEQLRLHVRVVAYGKNRHLLSARNVTQLYRLEQIRKDFIANVSHELRSPLTVVVGYLETLSDDGDLPEKWQRPLQQMSQQAGRMCLIVDDLLRLSRLEADSDSASERPLDVADILELIAKDARALSGGKHDISVEAGSPDTLLGEYNDILSAFANLVFNAVQYTPEGGRIRLHWVREKTHWLMRVEDSGIGIEASHLPRLTERFYRVDKARSRELGGTGLGLAITKHILLRHGARLDVTSEPGVGSTFSCVFPQSRVVRVECDAAEQSGVMADRSGGETGVRPALLPAPRSEGMADAGA